jgi:hypothetical protein
VFGRVPLGRLDGTVDDFRLYCHRGRSHKMRSVHMAERDGNDADRPIQNDPDPARLHRVEVSAVRVHWADLCGSAHRPAYRRVSPTPRTDRAAQTTARPTTRYWNASWPTSGQLCAMEFFRRRTPRNTMAVIHARRLPSLTQSDWLNFLIGIPRRAMWKGAERQRTLGESRRGERID